MFERDGSFGFKLLGSQVLGILARVGVQVNDIHNHIDEAGRHLVSAHIDWACVAGHVDLALYVEQVCLRHTRPLDQGIEKILESVQLGDELLNDLAERFKDRVVVDGGQVVADVGVDVASIVQIISNLLDDVLEDIRLVLVVQAVGLVDEYLDIDVGKCGLQIHDGSGQTVERLGVLVLCIDDPDESTNLGEDLGSVEGRIEVVELAGKVPDLEVHERSELVSVVHEEETDTYSITSF